MFIVSFICSNMDAKIDPSVPQWKRDLIQRLRNKNKWFSDSCDEQEQQLLAGNESVEVGRPVQQPNLTCSSSSTAAVVVPVANVKDCSARKCNEKIITMVKDRVIDCDLENNCVNSDNEELHYGPGIVKKLKNHYLSLTLRECNAQVRPSILPLRKATSLENLLDDGESPNNKPSTHYSRYKPRFKENETKNFTNNRYNASRGVDLKRARSVEAISRNDEPHHNIEEPLNDTRLKHQSFHEEMLISKEGNGVSQNIHDNITSITSKETKPFSNTVNHKINRPKRITPLMSEKEKPPLDVVKQTKRIFEGKAEQRTKQPYQTGDVAAKVASYKNIIQTKNNKKPPIKQKPVVSEDSGKSQLPTKQKPPKTLPIENGWKSESIKSPPDIPDVSKITSPREDNSSNQPNLSETPDLILHSSPVKNVYSPGFRILASDNFLRAEIVHCNNFSVSIKKNSLNGCENDESDGIKLVTADGQNNIGKSGNSLNMSSIHGSRPYLPISKDAHTHTSPTFTNITLRKHQLPEKKTDNFRVVSPILLSPLTLQEIEKNHINSSSTKTVIKVNSPIVPLLVPVENVKNMEVNKKVEVPKHSLTRKPKEQNSIVFKFTDRRDVPDYVYNDGKIRTGKIEKPKVGEGGIILLPGVSLDESAVDDEEDDWMLILAGPPSPCDIDFVNGNILIDGRSSLSQKSKKSKMRIKFVEALPEIYEYPSEASLALEIKRSSSPLKEAPIVNTVSTITGTTSLANYIPKLGSTEEFRLGITRSTPIATSPSSTQSEGSYQEESLQEVEKPVLFSAGTNSDILF